MPALIHSGQAIFSDVSCIEELAERYPEAKIILGHMGHGNIVEIERAVGAASRYPNVYLETSGMPMPNWIAEGVRAAPERVLFGSDTPFHPVAVERLKVGLSGLDDEAVRAVLNDNAQRLFFEQGG
jgi:predicted TIM-barrel fold metal-dependent hydrolase